MTHMDHRKSGCPSMGPLHPGAKRDLTHVLRKYLSFSLYLFSIYNLRIIDIFHLFIIIYMN